MKQINSVSFTAATLGAMTSFYQSVQALIGVRTNLASWVLASPSLGVDVQWGGRWQATLSFGLGGIEGTITSWTPAPPEDLPGE